MSRLIDPVSSQPRVGNILTELDHFDGIEIGDQLPNDGDLVKLKLKPEEREVEQEFAFGKISKVFKGAVGEVRVQEDEYKLLIELTIHQYVLNTGEINYSKWDQKKSLVLSDILKWKLITDVEYRIVNYAFDPPEPQPEPEPEEEENPLTPYVESVSGGRRRTSRKSKRKSRKTRRSHR